MHKSRDKYYFSYSMSGKTWLRNVKVTALTHNPDGSIVPIMP